MRARRVSAKHGIPLLQPQPTPQSAHGSVQPFDTAVEAEARRCWAERDATPPTFVISLSPLAHCCLRWLRLRLAELHPPLSRVEAVLRNGKHAKCRVLSGGAGTRSWRHDFVTRRANSWRASQPPHSCRSAGKQPMALVSDLLQNEHWMVAQSGERQQRSGQGCA